MEARGRGEAEALETFAILTTAANEVVVPIHHRMPVILASAAFGPWLAGAEVALRPQLPMIIIVRRVNRRLRAERGTRRACVGLQEGAPA